MQKRMKRLLCLLAVVILTMCCFALPAAATGDVAGAVQSTWTSAQAQIKAIVNNVVFPVIDVVLVILFFVKVSTSYFEYRKHGQFEFAAPAILFACLVFTLTAPSISGALWGFSRCSANCWERLEGLPIF